MHMRAGDALNQPFQTTLGGKVVRRARATMRAGPGLCHLPGVLTQAAGASSGKLGDHAAGVACPLSPVVRASSYSREMSLFV